MPLGLILYDCVCPLGARTKSASLVVTRASRPLFARIAGIKRSGYLGIMDALFVIDRRTPGHNSAGNPSDVHAVVMRGWRVEMSEKAMVLRSKLLSCQACVPADWTDEQVREFVEAENPCGTEGGWHLRKQGHPDLSGCDERVRCEGRDGFVHIMFDA